MSVIHRARSGKVYYLHVSSGKNQKVRYYFSLKPDGLLIQSLPNGYEIYETVNAQVFLRKKQKKLIKDDELALVQKTLKNHAEEWRYKAEIRKNMIVIHTAAQDYDWIDMLPSASGVNKGKIIEMKNQNTQYMPVMHFILQGSEKRLFSPERYCFKGSIDDWIPIGDEGKLSVVIHEYIKHLGKESFFELI